MAGVDPASSVPHAERRSLGRAWLVLTFVLALHVADEAAHDFLATYNPIAHAIKTRWSWLPLPEFTFGIWLAGLALAIVGLALLAPMAFRGGGAMRCAAVVFAALMVGNGTLHLGGSLYYNRVLPGTWTAPLLLVAGAWLLLATRRAVRAAASSPPA
jgi:hypothetical protein